MRVRAIASTSCTPGQTVCDGQHATPHALTLPSLPRRHGCEPSAAGGSVSVGVRLAWTTHLLCLTLLVCSPHSRLVSLVCGCHCRRVYGVAELPSCLAVDATRGSHDRLTAHTARSIHTVAAVAPRTSGAVQHSDVSISGTRAGGRTRPLRVHRGIRTCLLAHRTSPSTGRRPRRGPAPSHPMMDGIRNSQARLRRGGVGGARRGPIQDVHMEPAVVHRACAASHGRSAAWCASQSRSALAAIATATPHACMRRCSALSVSAEEGLAGPQAGGWAMGGGW